MKLRTSQQLYTYWNELRGGRLAPRRFEVEPSAIAGILPDTFILEREDRHKHMFRLAGTRLCERFGREFRGTNLLDLWTPQDREVVIRVLESVTRDGAVGVLGLTARAPGSLAADFELLMLPLVHTGQSISRVLGSIASPATPLALAAAPFDKIDLTTFDVVWPDGRPFAVVSKSPTPVPFLRDTGASRLVRHERRSFRVYEGGRADPATGREPDGSK